MTDERALYLRRKIEAGDNSITGAGSDAANAAALAILQEWDELEVEGHIRVARRDESMSAAGRLYKATATLTHRGRDFLRRATA